MAVDMRTPAAWLISGLAAIGRRPETRRALTVGVLVAAFASGIATYVSITGSFNVPRSPHTVLLFLLLDLVFLLTLAVLVAWRLVALWLERRPTVAHQQEMPRGQPPDRPERRGRRGDEAEVQVEEDRARVHAGVEPRHPIQVLAYAYGIDDGP